MTADAEVRIRAAVDALAAAIVDAVLAEAGPAANTPDRLYDVSTAASMLGVARSTVYAELGAGRLRSAKARRRRLIPASAISEYIAAAGGRH